MVTKRGILRLPALFLLCCLIAGQAFAAPVAGAATITVTIDGKQLAADTAPFIQDGRVLVPFRALFEALGAAVGWDADTRTVSGERDGKKISLAIGSKTAYVGGAPVALDVPAAIDGGRTFVPLRFVGEALGADVSWDGASSTVIITTLQATAGTGGGAAAGGTTGAGGVPASGSTTPRPITITDSNGRGVTVDSPVQRIVICDNQTADAICALGAGDRIVGAPVPLSLANMLNQKIINSKDVANLNITTPVPEKIITLRPDVVFLPISQDPLLISKLDAYDIPVVQLDFSKLDVFDGSILTLGQILGTDEGARELAAFVDKYRGLVADRLKDLPLQDEPRVYWEGAADYSACGKGTPDANILTLAKLNNVNDNVSLPWTTVTPEWVLAKDPDAIVRCPDTSNVTSGYGLTTDAMKGHLDDLTQRPGWSRLSAISGGRTYIMSRSLLAGPQAVVGLLYTAKWMHPDLFPDVDPAAVHGELLTTFYELDYNGAWAYPAPAAAAPAS